MGAFPHTILHNQVDKVGNKMTRVFKHKKRHPQPKAHPYRCQQWECSEEYVERIRTHTPHILGALIHQTDSGSVLIRAARSNPVVAGRQAPVGAELGALGRLHPTRLQGER